MRSVVIVWIVLAAVSGCESGDIMGRVEALNRFATLFELLANPSVQLAIRELPAGDGVVAGEYYSGTTPNDVTGVWSTTCCGGQGGKWPTGNGFGGTFDFRVVGPERVDMLSALGRLDETSGEDSFIVGTAEKVTLFLQLSIRCKKDGEMVRAVAIDRFIHDDLVLRDYVRSYVVLARDHAPPWECFIQPVGTGAVSSYAVFGKKG
jgi:hypothetical protein